MSILFQKRMLFFTASAFLALLALPLNAAYAHDEVVYFSVMSGASLPVSYTNVENVGGSFESGTTADDLDLENSLLYGAKAGIYSKSGILGLETEVFSATHDINSQTRTFYEPTFGPFQQTQEGEARVTTWALNVVARIPQPDGPCRCRTGHVLLQTKPGQ